MEEKPNYYSIIPAEVRYDNDLSDKAKLLYSEITALSNKNGYCFASNQYFAELYETSQTTIKRMLKQLEEKGYIERKFTYKAGTKEILNRYVQICTHPSSILILGGSKNGLDNNTSINNIEEIKEIYKEKIFEYDWLNNEEE